MSEKYVLMRDDKTLAKLASWTEAQEMKRFMRRWHPGNAYAVMVQEDVE